MSDDGGLALLLLGPAGGAGLYWMLYRYYRNTDKSHAFERETEIKAQPVTGASGRAEQEQGESAVVAHHMFPTIQRAMPSRKVPTVIAAVSNFHCCTGTLPMVSPVRPFTAM